MLWDNHDIKTVKTHGLVFETRTGLGRFLVSALNHGPAGNAAGEWLRDALLDHLLHGPPPRKTLKEETWKRLKQKLHEERISGMLEHYDFITERVVAYFRKRLDQAPRDAAFALDYVKRNACTVEQQQAALRALTFKTEVLWAQLDALWLAYVEGMPAPGAWRPGDGMRQEDAAA